MKRAVLLGLGAALATTCGAAFAAEKEPVQVRGDRVEYLQGEGKVIASGNVEALYRDTKLTCDQATIYMETKDAYLRGRVRLVQLSGLLKGEEILYNFETKKGTVLEAEGESGPWRTRGDRAQKISPDAYLHRGGYLTSCDFEQPHTRLQAREVKVFLDDRVVLRNAVMYVGKMPLFYVPSYTHPLDDKRPRVTLIPGKSKEWGPFLLSAWRVYFHENLQGRFHVDYRERLDLAYGLDLKYQLPIGGEGIFRQYYTHQRSLQRKHFYSKFSQPKKDKPTVEVERFRFQLRHLWEVDDFTRATLEYHENSDPTLTKDFFEREFEEDTANPSSYFQVIRTAPWYGLTFLLRKRVNRYETLTEQLPLVRVNVRPLDVPWLPKLERWLRWPRAAGQLPVPFKSGWLYQSSYTFERSLDADKTNGSEDSLTTFDTLQELYYPMRMLRIFNFRPFFRFRETMFSRGAATHAGLFRQAAAAGFDLNTKFFRVFPLETNLWGLDIQRLRHMLTPTLTYEYQGKPTLSADRFIRSDGLAKGNRLTPGLEQKLQTKRMRSGRMSTVDVARFNTTMPYDVEGSSGVGGQWNNVNMDLELLPYSWMRVEADATVDPHIGKVPTINADLVLQPGLGDTGYGGRKIAEAFNPETGELQELPWAVGLGWRYQRNTSGQLTLETVFNLGKKWRVGIYQAFDVKRFVTETSPLGGRTVKKIYDFPEYEYRLRRDLHEWTVELIYNVRRAEGETVLLLFRLKASPELPLEVERSYHKPKGGRNFKK